MDPAALLMTIARTLDTLSEAYTTASSTLGLIRSQIKILETGTLRIQEWLHFTDPSSKTLVQPALQDAVATVRASLHRLNEDLEAVAHAGPKTIKLLGRTGSDQWVKTKFVYSEGRMRKHLTDVRECASLMHFTLNVCQLPVGNQQAEQEVRELKSSARVLHHAQTEAKGEARRSLMQASSLEQSAEHSANYNIFMQEVMAAEAELPDLSPPVSKQSSLVSPAQEDVPTAIGGPVVYEADRDELCLPSSAEVQSSRQTIERDLQLSVPHDGALDVTSDKPFQEVPSVPTANSQPQAVEASVVVHKTVKRKPVTRSSTTKSGQPPPVYPQMSTDSRSASSSTASQSQSVLEKVNPLTQSLSSLNTSDYLHVELCQEPGLQYPDSPPAYTIVSSSVPDVMSLQDQTLSPTVTEPVLLARENRLEDLRAFIKSGGNINDVDPRTGRTAIMEAARLRRWDICRILTQSGSYVHLKDVDGNTALHLAAAEGDVEICQMILLTAGAHLEAGKPDFNKNAQTPLELAIQGHHSETVLRLLNNASARPKKNDEVLSRAFLETVRNGDVASTQAFLAKDITPRKMRDSWKPIAYAAQSGSVPMVELMLNHKCSLKERSPAGWTALHFAANHGHQHMAERLLRLKVPWKAQTKQTGETALHLASAAGHTGTAVMLVAHKDANVTATDANQQEAIHHAFRNGDLKLVNALMEAGAKPQNTNRFGWKPIHIAAARGHATLVADLMTRGVSINEKLASPSVKSEKAINDAARRGYWAEIRWPSPGSRPLHLALEFGHDDVATMLIAGGAKLEESDTHGWRPLHYAAFHCRPDMVELLLQRGATPDAKTDDGNTALSLGFREHGLNSTQEQRDRIVELLQVPMSQKRPKIKDMLKSAPTSQSKVVIKRNLAWHKAQLADALYQTKLAPEGEDDQSAEGNEEGGLSRTATSDGQASSLDITKI